MKRQFDDLELALIWLIVVFIIVTAGIILMAQSVR
jgi:hypothetical protein